MIVGYLQVHTCNTWGELEAHQHGIIGAHSPIIHKKSDK